MMMMRRRKKMKKRRDDGFGALRKKRLKTGRKD